MRGLQLSESLKEVLPKIKGIDRIFYAFTKVLNICQQQDTIEILKRFLKEGTELTAQELDGEFTQILQ